MLENQKIPFPRLFAESLAIIVSILLAFAIDAWWDDIQNRKDERLILESLLEEFQEKTEVLTFRRTFNEAILNAARELLRIASESEATVKTDEIDRLVEIITWMQIGNEWDTAALNSLIAGGELSKISNRELREKLARWVPVFEQIKLRLRRDGDFNIETLNPFLIRHTQLPQIWASGDHYPGFPELPAANFGEFKLYTEKVDHTALLSNREFQNIVSLKMLHLDDILSTAFEGIEENLDDTIELIETELRNR